MQQKKFKEAEEIYEKLIKLDNQREDYFFNLAKCKEYFSDPDSAIANYKQAIKLNSAFAKAHNNLGVLYAGSGNFEEAINSSAFSGLTGNCLKHLTLSSITSVFSPDKLIVGTTTGAKALVDKIDSNKVFFHQTDETGFRAFLDGEALTESNGTGQGSIDSALVSPLINPASVKLQYLNNRTPVDRSSSQNEDIKIILQI